MTLLAYARWVISMVRGEIDCIEMPVSKSWSA